MPARKIYRRNDGVRCLSVPVEFYPTTQDLVEAIIWYVDVEESSEGRKPWPKTQKAVLDAYRERVRSYGLQDFYLQDLYLMEEKYDDDGNSNRDDLIAALEERATKIVNRLFPDLKEN